MNTYETLLALKELFLQTLNRCPTCRSQPFCCDECERAKVEYMQLMLSLLQTVTDENIKFLILIEIGII